MYIIIVGGGNVGYYLCKALMEEGHEVLVLEKNPKHCERINDELGSVCTRGDGCEASTLTDVGTARADMLIAVTDEDEDNLVACQLAKYKFNVPHTIARITNPKNEALFKKLDIDVTVSSTTLILEHIELEVPTHPLTHLMTAEDRDQEIVEVRIPPDSAAVGKQIKELLLPSECILSLVLRKNQRPWIPSDDTALQVGDQIIAVTKPETEEKLRTALTSSNPI